jgi:parallel beta-helix repeat protein
MRRTAILCTLAASALAFAAADGAATRSAMLVVDRDRVQCANADFASIQAAVDAAQPGDVIRVCPDVYPETVTIDKPLTLLGRVGAVEAVDCFADTVGVDSTRQAIVDPAAAAFSVALKLEADDVVLRGFVVQGASVGIDASDRYSGYRIKHNLIRSNALFGVDFGSRGARTSRVDHNCIRENRYGLVSELDDDLGWRNTNLDDAERARRMTIPRDLVNARVDHNFTFRNTVGLDLAGPGSHNAVTMEHNVSREDSYGIALQNSADGAVIANDIRPLVAGIAVGGATTGLGVAANTVKSGRQGIVFVPLSFFIDRFSAPVTGAVIANNVVTGQALDGIVAGTDPQVGGRLHQSFLLHNVTSDNLRDGIVLRLANSGNVLRGNVAERNGEYGIYAQGAIANLFEANRMFGNGVYDARDENRAANTWSGNHCLTDFPAGTICGVG